MHALKNSRYPYAGIAKSHALVVNLKPVPSVAHLHPQLALELSEQKSQPAIIRTKSSAETKQWIQKFSLALVEVLSGNRNPNQLFRHFNFATYQLLASEQRKFSCDSWKLTSLRASQPTRLGLEITLRISNQDRSRAVAIRLDYYQTKWICTDLIIG